MPRLPFAVSRSNGFRKGGGPSRFSVCNFEVFSGENMGQQKLSRGHSNCDLVMSEGYHNDALSSSCQEDSLMDCAGAPCMSHIGGVITMVPVCS